MMNTLLRAYGAVFGHQNYARFAIISYVRTGSNYLSDGIDSSKSIRMYHEIFAGHNRELGRDFNKIMAKLYGRQEKKIQNVGFKLFYYHLTEDEWAKFLLHKDFKIIHLTRSNRLRTLVSLEIALQTNKWTSGSKNLSIQSKIVSLNPDKLIKNLEEMEEFENIARERFRNRKMIEVVYEHVTKDPAKEFLRIGSFLGIKDVDPNKIHLQRQNPESLRDLIANYDEVYRLLNKTRFAEYLSS